MDSRSKYANLPFVAVGEKDVFETDDLPEADQLPTREPLFDASIDVISCGTLEAFQRFNDKKENLFQGTLWEKTTNESLLEKYNRLTEETKELIDFAAKDPTNESNTDLILKVNKLADQLQELQVLRFDNSNTIKEIFDSADKSVQPKPSGDQKGSEFSYKLWYRPEKTTLTEASKVNSLEQRIKTIEEVLGTNQNKCLILNNYLKDKSLSEAVQELTAKVSQFDQNSLERVDSRLHMITDKLSQIAERKQQFEELEKNSKINELYELIEKTEKLRSTLPNVLQRLEALSELQEQALQFSSGLSYLDSLQTQIADSMKTNEKQLEVMKESFEKNIDSIKDILLDFDKRLNALK